MSVRQKIVDRLAQHFGNIPDLLRRRRWLVLTAFLGFLALSVFGLSRLKMDMTIEGWFAKDDPTLIAFNKFHAEFGSEDGLYIIYKPKDGDVFSQASLEAVSGIQQELINFKSKLKPGEQSALEHIVKVNTLVTAPVLTAEGDVLSSRPLVGSKVPSSPEALAAIRALADSQKQFPLQYFSRDHKYGGINVETNFGAIPVEAGGVSEDVDISIDDPAAVVVEDKPVEFKPTDMTEYYALYEEVKKIIYKPEYTKHLDYYAVGNTAAAEHDLKMAEEMGNLYMAALLIIIVLLWFLFRSASAVVWSILIVILSTVFTLGIAGIAGLTVTGFLILTLLLILTVGIADAVHMLTGYTYMRKEEGIDHQDALRKTYRYTGVALLLTGFTNMVGTMALNITPVVPIQNFAIMSTLGILFALLLSIYLLPILVDIWPTVPKTIKPEKAARKRRLDMMPVLKRQLEKVVPMVEKRPAAFIVPFMLLFAFCIYGATQVKVDTQILDQYPADSTFVQSVEVADKHMMGAYSMVVYLDFKEDFALQDPEVLKAMEELQKTFESKYKKYVVMTNSLADVTKDANQKLNGGGKDHYLIPDTREVLSQTLYLFNSADPSERQRLVDDNYRNANIRVALHSYGSYEYYSVLQQMRADIDQMMVKLKTKYPKAEVEITGVFALAMQASQYLTQNQAITFGIAIAAVSIILLLVFGSVKVGLIALIPNLIPATLTLGLLGLSGITLDFYTMMLAPIIIGISIDDTVHFISQYQRQLGKDGDVNAALRRTMSESGQSVVFTSLILGLGFGIMSLADSAGTSNMGKFGALAIFMGLLNDLFLLPALLLAFKSKAKAVPAAVEESAR
ncbi:MAG: MMPL family transporter [Lysobacter sp.]|nr:MMPL family transporter [Lysobacter sp.]